MKDELKQAIDEHKCYDYLLSEEAGRKELIIKIALIKEVSY
jgi:hypothetical protein